MRKSRLREVRPGAQDRPARRLVSEVKSRPCDPEGTTCSPPHGPSTVPEQLRSKAQARSVQTPVRAGAVCWPLAVQLYPAAGRCVSGSQANCPSSSSSPQIPAVTRRAQGCGEAAVRTWNWESVFALRPSQGALVSPVTRQSACSLSSDSVSSGSSIGPNYIMYVNFHLQSGAAWTALCRLHR